MNASPCSGRAEFYRPFFHYCLSSGHHHLYSKVLQSADEIHQSHIFTGISMSLQVMFRKNLYSSKIFQSRQLYFSLIIYICIEFSFRLEHQRLQDKLKAVESKIIVGGVNLVCTVFFMVVVISAFL